MRLYYLLVVPEPHRPKLAARPTDAVQPYGMGKLITKPHVALGRRLLRIFVLRVGGLPRHDVQQFEAVAGARRHE